MQWGQVMFVVLGVGGLFISSTLAIEFARTLGALKPALVFFGAAVFGFAAAMIAGPGSRVFAKRK